RRPDDRRVLPGAQRLVHLLGGWLVVRAAASQPEPAVRGARRRAGLGLRIESRTDAARRLLRVGRRVIAHRRLDDGSAARQSAVAGARLSLAGVSRRRSVRQSSELRRLRRRSRSTPRRRAVARGLESWRAARAAWFVEPAAARGNM